MSLLRKYWKKHIQRTKIRPCYLARTRRKIKCNTILGVRGVSSGSAWLRQTHLILILALLWIRFILPYTVTIIILHASCSYLCLGLRCTTNQFECRDRRQCIDARRRCDSRIDCRDRSDELRCRKKNAFMSVELHGFHFKITFRLLPMIDLNKIILGFEFYFFFL